MLESLFAIIEHLVVASAYLGPRQISMKKFFLKKQLTLVSDFG